MWKALRHLARDHKGAALVEYALIIAGARWERVDGRLAGAALAAREALAATAGFPTRVNPDYRDPAL